MNVDQITLNHTTIQNLALQIKYSRHLLQFCWMWIFSWIKLSWHFCSTWDKLGWLNWFWKLFPEGLFSFNPKRFSYSYAWSCSLYERSFTLSLISKWWVFFRVPISLKQSENSNKNCSSLTFTTEICFIRFRFSLVANPRIGTDFELTKINETSKWSFLCFRVNEHFPSTGILELYVDNFMFLGQRSSSG